MSTTTPLSRIARQLTLRRLEVTAVSATVLAFALTKILVGGTPLQETNPFALELVGHLGWTGVGIVAVVVEGAIFAGYRRLEPHFPRVSLAGGGLVAAMGVVDGVWNIRWLATVGMPETMLWAPVVESVGVVAMVGIVLLVRPSPKKLETAITCIPLPSPRSRQVITSVAVVLLLATSVPAAWFSPTVSASGGSDISYSTGLDINTSEENLFHQEDYSSRPESWENVSSDFSEFGENYDGGQHDYTSQNIEGDYKSEFNISMSTGYDASGDYSVAFRNSSGHLLFYIKYRDDQTSDSNTNDAVSYKIYNKSGEVAESYSFNEDGDVSYWENGPVNPNIEYSSSNNSWRFYIDDGDGVKPNSDSGWMEGTFFSASDIDTVEVGSTHGGPTSTEYRKSEEDARSTYENGQSEYNLDGYSVWTGDSTGGDVSGTAENQNGQPCVNCTVTVTGIDREELDADPNELDAEAQEILNELEDPTPPNWSTDRTLTGSDGLFTEADTKYVAAHEKGDWGLSRTTDSPNLGNPSVQLPANEEIALSVWDPDSGGLVQDGVNNDLPGGVDDDTDIVVESIDHDGGTVDTRTLETDTTYDTVIGGEHDLATTELPAGFYRVYPEDHPETSYVIVVGDPQEIANTIRGDLKDEAGHLTAQAERVQEYKDRDVLKQYTTTTDENGSFSVDVPDSVTRVSVQAHKTPPGINENPQNASLQDVRDYYAVTDYNGSYVMPASAETHSVPANDITVDTVETEAPQYADLGRYANATEAFQALLQNMSYSELPSSLQQRLEDVDRERLEENANELQRLSNENSQLESRIEEIREERDLEEIEINDSSDEELREQIQAQQQAISELRSTIETLETDTEVSDGLASSRATFAQDLSKDQVRVVANFQNGTSQEVSDEYISLDHSAGTIAGEGGTEVAVEDYPLGDASGVTFDYVVVTENGLGETTTNAVKPGADSIGLDAISLSSLHPGPDEQVDVTLVGDDETQVTEITDVRAVSPDGEELDTSTEGADTATFRTDGEGRHYVEVEFETASGEEGTLTHRIAAGESDRAMPPGIRVKDTPFGTVAVVGDGYESGAAEVSNGGQNIDVTAQVGSDEDAPARTHLYAHGADLPPTSTLSVDIVRGDQQRAVQRHVEVTAHLPAIRSEKATFYRGDNALPREGEGKLADVSTSSDETTIVTVTDARGSLELKTNSNPGWDERINWWIDRNTPEVSLGVLGQLPALPTAPVSDVPGGPLQAAAPAPTIHRATAEVGV